MKNISSRNNPQFKELRQLVNDSQARKKANLCIIEGTHLCETALQKKMVIQLLVVAESQIAKSEISELIGRFQSEEISVISMPDEMMAQLTLVDSMPGLMALLEMPQPCLPKSFNETIVVLDALQDPGNVGSIMRSACAAGIRHIVCGHGTVSVWSPKVLRSAMGAHFFQTIYEKIELSSFLCDITLPVIATSSHTSKTIYESQLSKPLVWLLGNEGQGVAIELSKLATDFVTIPQQMDIESMNVAASAAVCFF